MKRSILGEPEGKLEAETQWGASPLSRFMGSEALVPTTRLRGKPHCIHRERSSAVQ